MEKAVVAEGLRKSFGTVVAIDRISFWVNSGEVFGFLGPNGAGKTTTVRILTGILKQDSGRVLVMGVDVLREPTRAKQSMGVVPEQANAYGDLSPWQNLMLMGKIYGVSKRLRERRAEQLLSVLELLDRRDDKVREFSRGMKQKLLFAIAVLHAPPLLFLDEPTSGLDVQSARLIRQMIDQENRRGTTVFLTTHNMDEASRLCHRIGIIRRGDLVAIDTPEQLRKAIEERQLVEVKFNREPGDTGNLRKLQGVGRLEVAGGIVRLFTETPDSVIRELVAYAQKNGLEFVSLNTSPPTLEDVFVELTK
ncbi:ATP-binding protein [candidate division TA06 bacterium DG_26]|uniref:ATP-binding protein n=1 Tax=candidate division TA06 bacterium DG_26 TaxID=1703771 RepID=A0A0S7WM81_UNCT6|nr:MAG: ATP-binding protein [candidate division TA06 bacterium DG_26]